jgi:hypothetical protein
MFSFNGTQVRSPTNRLLVMNPVVGYLCYFGIPSSFFVFVHSNTDCSSPLSQTVALSHEPMADMRPSYQLDDMFNTSFTPKYHSLAWMPYGKQNLNLSDCYY